MRSTLNVKSRLGEQGGDVSTYVEQLVQDHLAFELDPAVQAVLLTKTRQGLAELDAGLGMDAQASMRTIADEFEISLNP